MAVPSLQNRVPVPKLQRLAQNPYPNSMSKIKTDLTQRTCCAIIKAARHYRAAQSAARSCTELILPSGKTGKSAALMFRYMKAEKALLAVCAQAEQQTAQHQRAVLKSVKPNDTVVITVKGVRVKKWRRPKSVVCHVPVKRSDRVDEDEGVGYAHDPLSLV